jgi:hypothetical protein
MNINPAFSLVIRLWNEEKNIPSLVQMIVESKLHQEGMAEVVLENNGSSDGTRGVVKGRRTVRLDPLMTRIVSFVYTAAANLILGLRIKDGNGLPKIFDRTLLDLIQGVRMKTFVFDAQIISLARTNKWAIREIPVTFHARRTGVSSWSRKRLRTCRESFQNLIRLRFAAGVPLVREAQGHQMAASQN